MRGEPRDVMRERSTWVAQYWGKNAASLCPISGLQHGPRRQ